MFSSIKEMFPDEADLVALEPEQLAGYLLEHLSSLHPAQRDQVDPKNYAEEQAQQYGTIGWAMRARVIMEAWKWMEREGLLAPDPYDRTGRGNGHFITRRGQQIKSRTDLDAVIHASMLPKKLLHPVIAQKVWGTFAGGDYDTAVFQAFKEVEVAVRKASGAQDTEVGVTLMRSAFHSERGPLADKSIVPAEREALMHLFSGAIGSYKNPSSHRHVAIKAQEAVEMIVLASHLMGIVDARTGASDDGAEGSR